MSCKAYVDGVTFVRATWYNNRLEVTVAREGQELTATHRGDTRSERCWEDAETGEVLSLGLCRAISAAVPTYVWAEIGRAVVRGFNGVLRLAPSTIGAEHGVYTVTWEDKHWR